MEERNRPRPRVVCLCGSTRFGEAFREANLRDKAYPRHREKEAPVWKRDRG